MKGKAKRSCGVLESGHVGVTVGALGRCYKNLEGGL